MSEQEPGSSRDLVEKQNPSSSTTPIKRQEIKAWPTVKEMTSVLNCVVCSSPASYPIMQCGAGHIICAKEGQNLKSCPCGADLIHVRLRWLKWMTERATYECPIKSCPETTVGQNDVGNHLPISHGSEPHFKGDSSAADNEDDGNSSPDEATTGSWSSVFIEPGPRDRAEVTTPVEPDVVRIPGFSTVLRGIASQTILDRVRLQNQPRYADVDTGYPQPYYANAYEAMIGARLNDPVVKEYSHSRVPRTPRGDKYLEDKNYGFGTGPLTDEQLGEAFRLSWDEEQYYFQNKAAIDHQPGHYSRIIRGNRTRIPLNAIYRELSIIRARCNSWRSHGRGGRQ